MKRFVSRRNEVFLLDGLVYKKTKDRMVPFVQKILRNAVLGVVGELEGYREGAEVEIRLK